MHKITVCHNRLLLRKHNPPARFPVSLPACHVSQSVKQGAAIPSQPLPGTPPAPPFPELLGKGHGGAEHISNGSSSEQITTQCFEQCCWAICRLLGQYWEGKEFSHMDKSQTMPCYLLSGPSPIFLISTDLVSWIPAWFRGSEHSRVPLLVLASGPAFSSSWTIHNHIPPATKRRGREEQPVSLKYRCLLRQHFTFRKHLSNLHNTQCSRLVLELHQ